MDPGFRRRDSLGRVGGVELSFDQAAWLIELRGGKLIRLQAFADRSEALEAAGLGEQAISQESGELAGRVREAGQIVALRDGTRALIRPIGPRDRKRLNEGFESASAESIFLRFLAPQPRLSRTQLDYLTAVDHVRHEALIAVDPETGQSFGTARYIRSDDHPETAEFAVGVGDRWMRIGLGTALLCALVLRAREAGVIRFVGLIHADNTAIRRLLEKVAGPYEARSAGHGAIEVAVDLRTGGR
jgi:RimJ/RimL family protein N-acetyltransferase